MRRNGILWATPMFLVLVLIEASDLVFAVDSICLLYTSDAADERSSVDLGGRRIIKKKTIIDVDRLCTIANNAARSRQRAANTGGPIWEAGARRER